MSRRKGRAGEQELARILREWLGVEITRNWAEQSHHGGSDILGVDGWAIEVKRCKAYSRSWWQQAVTQAESAGEKPLLVYRIDGMGRGLPEAEKWSCEAFAHDIIPYRSKSQHRVTMPLACWMDIFRESIDET